MNFHATNYLQHLKVVIPSHVVDGTFFPEKIRVFPAYSLTLQKFVVIPLEPMDELRVYDKPEDVTGNRQYTVKKYPRGTKVYHVNVDTNYHQLILFFNAIQL